MPLPAFSIGDSMRRKKISHSGSIDSANPVDLTVRLRQPEKTVKLRKSHVQCVREIHKSACRQLDFLKFPLNRIAHHAPDPDLPTDALPRRLFLDDLSLVTYGNESACGRPREIQRRSDAGSPV